MRHTLVALLTAAAFALTAAPAQAETWTAADRRADVRAQPYRPGGDPCQQPPDRRVRNDKRHDITALTVDGVVTPDFTDELVSGCCLTHGGAVVHPRLSDLVSDDVRR